MIEPIYLFWFIVFMVIYFIADVDEMMPFPIAIPLVIGVLLFMVLIGHEQRSVLYIIGTIIIAVLAAALTSFVIKSFKKNCLAVNLLDKEHSN